MNDRIPAETLERLWIMRAHAQRVFLNTSNLVNSLTVSAKTITNSIVTLNIFSVETRNVTG